jgi:hypothetical protein
MQLRPVRVSTPGQHLLATQIAGGTVDKAVDLLKAEGLS